MSTTSFVTGGTGLVGVELLRQLVADGHTVRAVVRDMASARAVAELGADPVIGDLREARGAWRSRLEDAEMVWHLGLPRIRVPLRRPGVARLAGQAAAGGRNLAAAAGTGRVVVMASTVLVWGDRPDMECGAADPVAPVGMGRVAHAAEAALADTDLRVVRLGWVYGPGGFAPGMVRGLRERRYRIVGTGDNPVPVVSAADAVEALRCAASLPTGVYAATERPVPTQRTLVEGLCAALGARRTDRLPPRMAGLSMGGELAHSLLASCIPAPGALEQAGWVPRYDWRTDLIPATDPAWEWGTGERR